MLFEQVTQYLTILIDHDVVSIKSQPIDHHEGYLRVKHACADLEIKLDVLDDSAFWYCEAKLYKPCSIEFTIGVPHFYFHYILENQLWFNFDSITDQHQLSNQYQVLYNPSLPITIRFKESGTYELFGIGASFSFFKPFLKEESLLSDFIKHAFDGKPDIIHDEALFITQRIRSYIMMLRSHPPYEGLQILLLESRLREVVLYSLADYYDQRFHTTLPEKDAIAFESIRQHLIKNPANPGSLESMARAAGMNKSKLNAIFRTLTGTTVFGYVFEERMQKALYHLNSNLLSIEEIAFRVGYSDTSSFSKAFKRRFGYAPSSLRA